jgi:hypothetical protein
VSGSVGAAGWIAHVAFWVLLAAGWQDLWPRRTIAFIGIWSAGYLLLPRIGGELFFMPLVAVLDLVLVMMVLYGDPRL